LRHTFASFGVNGEQNLNIVGRLLGHSKITTTQRYAHLAEDPIRKATEHIGEALAGSMAGQTLSEPILKRYFSSLTSLHSLHAGGGDEAEVRTRIPLREVVEADVHTSHAKVHVAVGAHIGTIPIRALRKDLDVPRRESRIPADRTGRARSRSDGARSWAA